MLNCSPAQLYEMLAVGDWPAKLLGVFLLGRRLYAIVRGYRLMDRREINQAGSQLAHFLEGGLCV